MRNKDAESHQIVGTVIIILAIFTFVFYRIAEGVILDPKDAVHHTTVVYYDGYFSIPGSVEDTNTALYVLNQSDELIYATVYEYDKKGKEVKNAVQILGRQNQFIKTEGPGVVYLMNSDTSATSTIKFSRWAKFKKLYLPTNYKY